MCRRLTASPRQVHPSGRNSNGSVAAYPADEASERAITEFLIDFTTNCGAEKVHFIAHSMGNRVLLRALQRIAANAQTQGRVKFGQVFVAAPDVDRDLFLDLARLYLEHAERTALYASDGDLPVQLGVFEIAQPMQHVLDELVPLIVAARDLRKSEHLAADDLPFQSLRDDGDFRVELRHDSFLKRF
ncbi:MAG: alpha/beta hydrolase [Planctomycetia bacterium]|nr:alpha/beta hydrolase [Planctomycetia bacterium]